MTSFDTTFESRPSVNPISRRELGLFTSLAGLILTVNPTSRGSPELPSWLRLDIGLPPAEQTRSFWDYR